MYCIYKSWNWSHTFDEEHQKSGSRIYLPRNVSLWPANGSSPLILRRLVHVEDSEKEPIKNKQEFAISL